MDSTQATATLLAAAIGGAAAIVGAVLGGFGAARARRWTRREQWWERFSWACEKAVSATPGQAELGLSVLESLIDARWAELEDNEMALAVANVINGSRGGGDADLQ